MFSDSCKCADSLNGLSSNRRESRVVEGNMPFALRTVEPRRLCLPRSADGGHSAAPFASLDEVCNRALATVLLQLSDLSHRASDVFHAVEVQSVRVFQRTRRIQQRLDNIASTVQQLDPKKVRIREFMFIQV